ncbi:MAG: hypothetical protein CSA58_08925 [Micrococcales bacterium]|nr:MAG: hypothetical protein CSB46_07020 [Micrococcales bacterium]PIE26539.1 MAG: hypothetical protein CSA58_08925 [Micrococcales bacterium]
MSAPDDLGSRLAPPDQGASEHGATLLPRPVKVALTIVAVEAVGLVLVCAFLIGLLAQNAYTDRGLLLATLVMSVLMLAGLLSGGFAVLVGRRWGRAPLVTWQLLQLFVAGVPALTTAWPIGVLLVALSVLGLAGLLSPGVTRHLLWREVQ